MTKLQNQPRRSGKAFGIFSAIILALVPLAAAAGRQGVFEPRREQLLNGLRVLLVKRTGDPDVILKMRVHSGAAFDMAGKEGSMALLSDALFDAETRRYVTEELGGRIEVSTTYDAISFTLAGRASDFDRLLELIRNAVINTQLTPEIFARLREERTKAAREVSLTPETQAERAVAARLFGVHPYGRLVGGSPESLGRIERTDLLLARERFLNPNNSTLFIAGSIEPVRVMRALRQSLGGWRKSDRLVPATFRQPEAPDARTLVFDRAGTTEVALRLAVRGLSAADRDRAAVWLLAPLVRERWRAASSALTQPNLSVRHDAHHEGGAFILGASVPAASAAQALESARAVLRELAVKAPTVVELEGARRVWTDDFNKRSSDFEVTADSWLDAHTQDIAAASASELMRDVNALTPADVQRVAARLFLNTPAAAVAVGDASRLREELARGGGVEVFGEAASKPEPATTPKPAPQNPSLQLKRP